MTDYWNRSGEVTVELNADKFVATLYIDGKEVLSNLFWKKLTTKELVKGLWEVRETNETYQKKTKWGLTKLHKKEVIRNGYKYFTATYGVRPTRVVKIFNAAVFKNAVIPYKEYFSLFYQSKSINPTQFIKVVKNAELLEQATKDGQKNILPLILNQELPPQKLKSVLGKGVWKKLTRNSFHRNKILVNYKDISEVMNYDSTALKIAYKHWSPEPSAHHWLKHVVGVPYSKHNESDARMKLTTYSDTKDMAARLQLPFNEKWSLRKMDEKHAEYSRLQQRLAEQRRIVRDKDYAERLVKLKATDLSTFYKQTTWEKDGVTATVLTTYERIVEEGSEMHHCVAGYAERCLNKDYVVVSLTDGTIRTTLGAHTGLGIDSSYRFSKDQHYSKCNSLVEDERFISLADEVIDNLNKMKLKKEEANA